MKFDDTVNGSLKPVLEVLNTDPRILTELVTRGLREIESVAREAYAQPDVDEARCIIEAATPLWFALEQSSAGRAPGGPTRLHDVLRRTGIDDAFQVADSIQWADVLAYARDALGDPERAQYAIARCVYMINDPHLSADAPRFWDEVIRRCERVGFTCVRSTVRALLDAQVIPANSTIVLHARAICSTVSAAAIEPELVDGFIDDLKTLTAARTACRYAPETPAETLEAGILVQLSGIIGEVYQRLPAYMQRTFRRRVTELAEDRNVPADDQHLLFKACDALDVFCEREHASNKRACEQSRRTAKRQAKEQGKQL